LKIGNVNTKDSSPIWLKKRIQGSKDSRGQGRRYEPIIRYTLLENWGWRRVDLCLKPDAAESVPSTL